MNSFEIKSRAGLVSFTDYNIPRWLKLPFICLEPESGYQRDKTISENRMATILISCTTKIICWKCEIASGVNIGGIKFHEIKKYIRNYWDEYFDENNLPIWMETGKENMLYTFKIWNTFVDLSFSPKLIIPPPLKEDKIEIRAHQLLLILPVLCVCAKFLLSL
jgi:hypothetical protein